MNPVSVDTIAHLGGDETLSIVASVERWLRTPRMSQAAEMLSEQCDMLVQALTIQHLVN
jgi:hypothetical protein